MLFLTAHENCCGDLSYNFAQTPEQVNALYHKHVDEDDEDEVKAWKVWQIDGFKEVKITTTVEIVNG